MSGYCYPLAAVRPQSRPFGDGFPSVSSSRLWLDRNRNVFSDAAGTTPATITGAVGSWRAVGGAWGTDLFAQSTGSLQPTLQSNGLQSDGVNDILTVASAIALAAGQFTIYSVQSRTSSAQIMTAMGHSTLNNGAVVYGTDSYIVDDAGSGRQLADAVTGLAIRRWRRTATDFHFKAGTASEGTMALAGFGQFTLDSVLGRSTEASNTLSRTLQIVLVTKNITPGDADDTAIITKLLALEPTAAWS